MGKNVLLAYSRVPSFTNTVRDYVEAFGAHSVHRVHYYDMDSGPIHFDLTPFDCIIFNFCFWGRCLAVSPEFRARMRGFHGLKIAIFQDEYDYFLWHRQTVLDIGIDTIVTCVPEAYWPQVFPDEAFRKVELISALTGYVPDTLSGERPARPLEERPWHIGYRSRKVPYYYGRLTREKFIIGERMKALCAERGIPANIEVSEESRLYGDAWPEFIGSCRTVLGTESGANVFDFDGTLKPAIEAYLKRYPEAEFETVHARFLEGRDGVIRMNQVSPRIFEAIALRTGLVLFEGEYSGVVRPWVHYIPLRKDFGNVEEVLAAVADTGQLETMIARAYADVIDSGAYSYRRYISRLDAHIDARVPRSAGYEPCYGLIGWRQSAGSSIAGNPGQDLQIPTLTPLRCEDSIPDPFLTLRVRGGAFHRGLMRRYERLLYSSFGIRVRAVLGRNDVVYRVMRMFARVLTGRWRHV